MEDTLELMTLGRARIELENRNFATLLDNDDTLVCLKTDCRWTHMAKIDVLVVVNDIRATGEGTLELDRILADVANFGRDYDAKMDVGCPPHGASRGRMIIVAYLCKEVESAAAHHIQEVAPAKQWCSVTFVTAQDASGHSFVLHDEHTAYWGRAMFPEIRFWAKLVTGQTNEQGPPSYARWWYAFHIYMLGTFTFMIFTSPWPMLVMLISLGLFLAQMLLVLLYAEYRRRGRGTTEILEPMLEERSPHIC
jgi:hypothetical protein